jgi:hypothetical protein
VPTIASAQFVAPTTQSTLNATMCGEVDSCAALSYTSTVSDGTSGFTCTAAGQCSRSTSCSGWGVNPDTGYMFLGRADCSPVVTLGDTGIWQNGQFREVGRISIEGAGGSLILSAATLDACTSGAEGEIQRDALSGGASTGHATRLCLCQSDGAASYAWRNVITGNVGTSSTCPD